MEETKKRKRKNILFAVAAVLLVALLTATPFLLDAKQKSTENKASILSAQVRTGTIRKTLSGTGTLTEEDAEKVSVPQGVEVTEYLVENGQTVRRGDPVAVVNRPSVMEAVSTVQKAMAEVETELETIRTGSDYTYLSAPASGRVKAVYAEVGDAAHDVILQHGALAILSLDGMMAVRFPADKAAGIGTAVTVALADGKETAGRVESVIDGEATVTFSDEYGDIGETVTVRDSGGRTLGSGGAFVHSAWKAMATGGTVSTVYIQKDALISVYGIMIVLSGTAEGGNYEELIAEHRAYEDIMEELFGMLRDGCLTAPCDGIVSGVDEDILELLSAEEGSRPTLSLLLAGSTGPELKLLSSNSPPDKQEANYNNVIGIVSDLSGSALLQNWSTQIDDYADTSSAYTATDKFTKKYQGGFSAAFQWTTGETEAERHEEFTGEVFADGTEYYEKTDAGEYVVTEDLEPQPGKAYYIKITETVPVNEWAPTDIQVGGIYVFAFDSGGELAFMIYITSGEVPGEKPSGGERPSGSGKPGSGGMPSGNSGGTGTGGSGAPSGGGSTTAAAKETRYPTEGTTLLSVTPQETVSVSITVDELDILSVHAGQEAEVTLDALKGQAFSGTITRVNTIASNEGGNSKYSAVVELERGDFMLGGMNASANITVEERENVLLIPAEALTEQDGRSAVYTAYDAKTETLTDPVPVETGLSDGSQVQILSGLREGDTVWYSYYDTLEIKGLGGDFPGGFPRA